MSQIQWGNTVKSKTCNENYEIKITLLLIAQKKKNYSLYSSEHCRYTQWELNFEHWVLFTSYCTYLFLNLEKMITTPRLLPGILSSVRIRRSAPPLCCWSLRPRTEPNFAAYCRAQSTFWAEDFAAGFGLLKLIWQSFTCSFPNVKS